MKKLPLCMAISHYDIVADLTSGRVPVEGVELNCLNHEITDIFYRFLNHREFDVSEMSFAKYASMVSQGDDSLIAIPVFPSRIFRHSCIYVRRDGPIRKPADLKGRSIGIPEWAQTAQLFARGFLTHQYGVDLRSINWIQGGINEPGRKEKVALKLPPGVQVTIEAERAMSDMLLSGEIDAVMSAHPPACFEHDPANVGRLFEDYMTVEKEYYNATKIFPIMHLVAIRREIVDAHPWVAVNLYRSFCQARERCIERALYIDASRFPIPWGHELAAQAQRTFGQLWPYGIEANRVTLEAGLQFAFEQGICHRQLRPEELFAKQIQGHYRT